jgi:hypothetical protein
MNEYEGKIGKQHSNQKRRLKPGHAPSIKVSQPDPRTTAHRTCCKRHCYYEPADNKKQLDTSREVFVIINQPRRPYWKSILPNHECKDVDTQYGCDCNETQTINLGQEIAARSLPSQKRRDDSDQAREMPQGVVHLHRIRFRRTKSWRIPCPTKSAALFGILERVPAAGVLWLSFGLFLSAV